MRFDEYACFDALGLAALVRRGEVSAADLLDTALARLDAVGSRINAIAVDMAEIGRARAQGTLSGPFAGVPFLLKDWGQEYRGQRSTGGSRARLRWVCDRHSSYTQRCLDAGLVIFGRTTTPELALLATTESALYGPTRNPWSLGHTPGGSSGGAASAVAAGIVPMAGASDGGGSIRIPASYCGLFGFRPGRGVVPAGPEMAEGWEGASSQFVLTRSVRDAAAMLGVLAGDDEGAPFATGRAASGFADIAARPPRRLRIGFHCRSALGPVDAACVKAVEEAVRVLGDLGHLVVEAMPAIDGAAVARCFLDLYLGQVAADVAEACRRTGASRRDFELLTRGLAALGDAMPAREYVLAHRQWNGFGRALGSTFLSVDLLLLPTTAAAPARIGELEPSAGQLVALTALGTAGMAGLMRRLGALQKLARGALSRTPFTQLSNLTGTPSMSVPMLWSGYGAEHPGLPVGVQFVGPIGSEALLLQVAAELEAARPWGERRPEL
jgi:amidase